jgi:hypothetical protein
MHKTRRHAGGSGRQHKQQYQMIVRRCANNIKRDAAWLCTQSFDIVVYVAVNHRRLRAAWFCASTINRK